MAFSASGIINNIQIGCSLRKDLKHTASLFNVMETSKEIRQNVRKRNVDLHKCGPYPDPGRFHAHLFQQLYAGRNIKGMSSHQNVKEGDGLCVRNARNRPCEDAAWSQLRVFIIRSEKRSVATVARRPLGQEEATLEPDCSF
ncbi:hypothetical protein XENOCAPTIV_028037 [Xenoophorus captivus]|uniref:Uncharacterized protein n=1 Tax=Xenoophorus captivus TaxID=1517983 RepID=A0ABV0RX60_9TELE